MIAKLLLPCVCISLAFGIGIPSRADAAPPHDEEPVLEEESRTKIGLVVDATEIDEEFRRQLEQIVVQELSPALEEAGFEVGDGVVDLVLRVRFTPTDAGRFRDHGIHFELMRGDAVEPAIQWVLCEGCVQVRLEEKLAQATPPLLEALRKATEASASSDGPKGDGGSSPEPGPTDQAPPKALGPLGGAGIGLAVLGVGLSVGGGIILADPTETTIDPGDQFGIERDQTNRGIALLVPGATLVVVGTVMLAVDLSKRAKARKRANSVAVIPTLSPTSAGISIGGRF